MLRRLLIGRGARAVHNLATVPNATLRVVAGPKCTRIIVQTNMETYSAQLEGTNDDGTPCADDAMASWAHADAESGDLDVTTHAHTATISIPASFNVGVYAGGDCDVDMKGWLEGTVDVVVDGRGSVGVNTVRGLLTRVASGGGDVRVDHVEGNLDVNNGDSGSVTLGKIMGEDVRVVSGGAFKSRAIYAKRLDVRAEGGADASVTSAEEGLLDLKGESTLHSAEGALNLTHRGGGLLTIQASEQLRALTVRAPVASGGAQLKVNLPSGMRARAEVLAASLDLGEGVEAVEVSRAGLSSGGAPAEAAAFLTPPAPLSTTGTKEFAGYESGSTTSATPWWSAAARNSWAEGGSETAAGSVSYLLGGAKVDGEACELRIVAAEAEVSIDSQSWFEQRLKGRTEHRPQPYR